MKRRIGAIIPFTVVLLSLLGVKVFGNTLAAQIPVGRNHYVHPSGNDSGTGSASDPWRSIERSLRSVEAGDILWLGAGDFSEQDTLQIPCGVSVAGAGSHLVNIQTRSKNAALVVENCTVPENFQRLGGFSLSAPSKTTAYGIRVIDVHGFTLFDVSASNFMDAAVVLDNVVNSQFYDLALFTSGRSYGDIGCGGTLNIGNLTHTQVHDITIIGGEAYGIKAVRSVPEEVYPVIIDSEFYNMDIRVDAVQCSLWDNFAGEFFQSTMVNSRIHHNRFNNVLSLPNQQNSDYQESLRIDHNVFDLCEGGAYAIELDRSNVEIDHNLFACGGYALASFSTGGHDNLRIHHNIFVRQDSVTNIMHFLGSVSNVSFDNNTVISSSPARLFYIGEQAGTKNRTQFLARNNLFVNTLFNRDTLGELGQVAILENNLFWGITGYGENAIIQDPLLALEDSVSRDHLLKSFAPPLTSPAIARGVPIAGLTDETPDIGAIDSDERIWSVGVQPRSG